MGNSFTKFYFLVVLMTVLTKTIHSQTATSHPGTIKSFGQYSVNKKTTGRIKWTWQLPASVKKAFNESQYKDWFIENMVRYDHSGKTFYRLYLNNGSILDGDHYDRFFKE